MSILSIQSHVAYGYVGNKAAVYPLQSMGYDVWPVNTVQFSNHTGYEKWQGTVFSAEHVQSVIEGILDLGVINNCKAILSGYMGSGEICHVVAETVSKFKSLNKEVIYLCDPVIGNNHCYVKPEVLEFFKKRLVADIITPNRYEAEILSNIQITNADTLKATSDYFHDLGVKVVVITGLKVAAISSELCVFISYDDKRYIIPTKEYDFTIQVNGTGDLFSALFLGRYLATKNPILALQQVMYYMEKVLYNTMKAGSRELKVLSVKYDGAEFDSLQKIKIKQL